MMNNSNFSEEKDELLKILLKKEGFFTGYEPEIKPRYRKQYSPLSSSQLSHWFQYYRSATKTSGQKVVNTLSLALRITGPLRFDPLMKSINEVVRRHEILRTNFDMVEGCPVQIVNQVSNIEMPLIDFSHLPEEEKDNEMKRLFKNETVRPFDLTIDRLLRLILVKYGNEKHAFQAAMPHIICDDWSLKILFREIALLYDAYSKGLKSPLPDLPIQYVDFASWEKERLNRPETRVNSDFWKNYLTGLSPFYFPTDYPRPRLYNPIVVSFHTINVPNGTVDLVNSLSHEKRITKFIILFASLNILISKWTGKNDIVIPVHKDTRGKLETQQLIGSMACRLPVRSKISANQTMLDFMKQSKISFEEVCNHQYTPIKDIQSVYSMNFFQTIFHNIVFNFITNPYASGVFCHGLTVEVLRPSLTYRLPSKDGLTIIALDSGDRIWLTFTYKTGLYKRKTIEMLADSFCIILEESCKEPLKAISQIDISDRLNLCSFCSTHGFEDLIKTDHKNSQLYNSSW